MFTTAVPSGMDDSNRRGNGIRSLEGASLVLKTGSAKRFGKNNHKKKVNNQFFVT